MPTTVVLTFDQPLDPGSAEDVRNYVILDPSGHRIRIRRAVLDPTRLTVTLHPAQRISIHHPYQLIVNGAGPGAVSNMSGQPLDSEDAGQPGSSDHVVLTWRQLVLGDVSKAFRIRYGLVPKGPRAKIPSGVSSPKAALGNRGGENGDGGGGGENGDGIGTETRKMVSAHGRRIGRGSSGLNASRRPSTGRGRSVAGDVDPARPDFTLNEADHYRSDDDQSKAAGGVLTAKQAPAGPAPLRRSVCAGAMTFSLYRRPALERRSIMLFSSWLRNSKRSAPAAHGAHKRPLATGQIPPADGSDGRSLLAQRLPADQSGRLRSRHCALHRLQPERLGHGFHAERGFRCGQHVHHRAGHVLQQLRPRAAADDHHPGVGIAGPRSGARDRAGRPPHRRRLQSDESTS